VVGAVVLMRECKMHVSTFATTRVALPTGGATKYYCKFTL